MVAQTPMHAFGMTCSEDKEPCSLHGELLMRKSLAKKSTVLGVVGVGGKSDREIDHTS
jgi:hypothetical protein